MRSARQGFFDRAPKRSRIDRGEAIQLGLDRLELRPGLSWVHQATAL